MGQKPHAPLLETLWDATYIFPCLIGLVGRPALTFEVIRHVGHDDSLFEKERTLEHK